MVTQTEYLKNIPCVLADAKISKWNVTYHVIGSILSRNEAKYFLSMTKHVSLPDTEALEPGIVHLATETTE